MTIFVLAFIRIGAVISIPIGAMHILVLLGAIPSIGDEFRNSVVGAPLCIAFILTAILTWRCGE